ncbi:hypothetical protein M5K25_000349 [Dendrobium thyrsiflorum]|uniref:Uncharacterized protein n=1 Tax=Dendrobium thyrsiflorum TaxID=117978 RepID=A0ABD0W6A6_DENTH
MVSGKRTPNEDEDGQHSTPKGVDSGHSLMGTSDEKFIVDVVHFPFLPLLKGLSHVALEVAGLPLPLFPWPILPPSPTPSNFLREIRVFARKLNKDCKKTLQQLSNP